VLFAPDETEAVVAALARPAARMVTLTVTDQGYEPAVDRLTAAGLIVAGLDRRRRAGTPPFTVVSCDNLPSNGVAARAAVLAVARAHDPRLADWIEREVAFPSTMVDRITPATTDATRDMVARRFGIEDRWPVVTEPFSQWVIEDRFCNTRPPLERVGVEFVRDVGPYEQMKKRLLNGIQSALGYVGYLLGHRDTAAAMGDPILWRYVERMMREEIAPFLAAVPGVDLRTYCQTLLTRLANPKMGDQLARLCRRGSAKVPAYLLPSIEAARRAGRGHELLTLAVAAWVRYLRGVDLDGTRIAIADPRLHELQPLAVACGDDPGPLMSASRCFGWLADDPMLVRSVARALESFDRHGLRATVDAYVAARRTGDEP
jgi:mannitol-1-phosphate/altronate dehydrogenase